MLEFRHGQLVASFITKFKNANFEGLRVLDFFVINVLDDF